jgi:hypothetical protein
MICTQVYSLNLHEITAATSMETAIKLSAEKYPKVSEKFLHHVWKFGWFTSANLVTDNGQRIEILHPGVHNHNAGPDFMNARIRIDGTLWWGNVEIHIHGSDWYRHKHQSDENYKNVILHVVLHNDALIYLHSPGDLPVLDLSQCLNWDIWESYQTWLNNYRWIPCESVMHKADAAYWYMAKDRLMIERLHTRVDGIFKSLEHTRGDWSQVAFIELCKGFGFNSNSLAMEMLANSIPYTIISRHGSDLMQVEALVFGQAGLLQSDEPDTYESQLRQEYMLLRAKYNLTPISAQVWNFGKVRPTNSPIIRLAQLAHVLSRAKHLASSLLNLSHCELVTLLSADTHSYWQTHKQFGIRRKKPLQTTVGKNSVQRIIINVVARLRFAHGKYNNQLQMINDALALLHMLPSENDSITSNWRKLGIQSEHAGDTQALLQLYSVYCTHEKCIECPIGIKLLQQEINETPTQPA